MRQDEFVLARFPARWNHLAEKDSRQINMLEQILIAKVFNFDGICSSDNIMLQLRFTITFMTFDGDRQKSS